MIQKGISMLYNIFCIAVWGGTMGVLVMITVFLCVGEKQSPEFKLNSVTVSEAENNDEILCSHTSDTSGWYKAEYEITLTGAKFSPYTYSASSAVYKPSQPSNSTDAFLAPFESITYSKLSPADFTLTLYVKAPDIQSAKTTAMTAKMGLRGVKQQFAFFSKDLQMNLPGFTVSNFDTESILA